ncbi:MAG: glycosyltransferase family 4 protein [Anaerolineaceae bacterium]|nr:glycosyltransferase family 4 protein [Anaerolineaceae bacterium]
MKILCFSINPIFPEAVSGGASKHLMNITRHLASKGHLVRIICPEIPKQNNRFYLNDKLEIWPVLPFHQPFPEPYAVAPLSLAWIVEEVNRHLAWADRFYIHDGELLLPHLHTKVPTILSFRDNYYPESILSTFINQGDEVICVSPYSANIVKASAGRVLEGFEERIHMVLNGIDAKIFRPIPKAKNKLLSRLPFDASQHQILLHPHRPDPKKGLGEAVEVLKYLISQKGMKSLKLVAPRWHESMSGSFEDAFFKSVEKYIQENSLSENIHFIDWLTQAEMPSFYSLGATTLCLGNIPEAFGNVAYESLACGTPSLVSRAGVHRSLLPDKLISKVDYGDVPSAAESVFSILQTKKRVPDADRRQIVSYFDLGTQLEAYEAIITCAAKRPPVQGRFCPVSVENSEFRLAPWCYRTDKAIYHDYLGKFLIEQDFAGIDQLLCAMNSAGSVEGSLLSERQLSEFYKQGILIPVTGKN